MDEGEGGVMTDSAEGMTLGEQSSAARRCEGDGDGAGRRGDKEWECQISMRGVRVGAMA